MSEIKSIVVIGRVWRSKGKVRCTCEVLLDGTSVGKDDVEDYPENYASPNSLNRTAKHIMMRTQKDKGNISWRLTWENANSYAMPHVCFQLGLTLKIVIIEVRRAVDL